MAFDKLKSLFIDWNEVNDYSEYEGTFTLGSIEDKRKKIYDYEENDDFKDFDSFNQVDIFLDDSNINSYIKQKDYYKNFQKLLFEMIDERNLKDSDVYNKVHIDRRLFHKIRNDSSYHPSMETIILLALSMELSMLELDTLLESASYSLPLNNNFSLVIRFCFINGIYDIKDVNNLLDKFDCELFNY